MPCRFYGFAAVFALGCAALAALMLLALVVMTCRSHTCRPGRFFAGRVNRISLVPKAKVRMGVDPLAHALCHSKSRIA